MSDFLQSAGIVLIGLALVLHMLADHFLHRAFHRLHGEMLKTIDAIIRKARS